MADINDDPYEPLPFIEPVVDPVAVAVRKGQYAKIHKDEMRERAAMIAVDMERGIYVDPRTGNPWKGGYHKSQIARQLGYSGKKAHNGALPVCMAEPKFSRAVEWERIKRDATYRTSIKEALPKVDAVVGGLLMEALKRVLLNPEQIPQNVLFGELRKFMEMKGEYEGALGVKDDVRTTITVFQQNIQGLPEAAREAAIQLFKSEMRQLSVSSNIIEAAVATEKRAS